MARLRKRKVLRNSSIKTIFHDFIVVAELNLKTESIKLKAIGKGSREHGKRAKDDLEYLLKELMKGVNLHLSKGEIKNDCITINFNEYNIDSTNAISEYFSSHL